jgi:phosphonopyruvate decarboxylase
VIPSRWFIDLLQARGIGLFAGVPCSFLSTLIDEVIARPGLRYVAASSEGEALSIVSGAWVGGHMGAVLCQNSGLGNMVSPLTSLNAIFRIPALLLISHRGKPGEKDEPQHALMGRKTTALLDAMEVPWAVLPKEPDAAAAALDTAVAAMAATHTPYALVVEKDSFAGEPAQSLQAPAAPREAAMTRAEALAVFSDVVPQDAPVIATTGKTGRELYTLRDRERNLYCVGSMGYANAMAHGLALARPGLRTYVLDGDGAALMHLGNLATIGAEAPAGFVHVLLDNGQYESTGGQSTTAANVDFCRAALALGYRDARRCATAAELAAAVREPGRGPVLLHVPILPGSMAKLGRPGIPPADVARRLRGFLPTSPEAS